MRSSLAVGFVVLGLIVFGAACRSEAPAPDVQGRIAALDPATPSREKGALLTTLTVEPEGGGEPRRVAVTTETEVIGRGRYRVAFSVLEVGYDVQIWLEGGSPSANDGPPVATRVVIMRSRL